MTRHSIFTRDFWVLCASTVFFMCSFSMLLPELPDFLASLGGSEYIGWIIGLFTLNAFFSRFVSGRMADTAGRMKVIYIGTAVTMIAALGYVFVWSVWSFLIIRFIHGMSTGFRPVGTTALLSDMVHISRRGEAMGYLGVAGNAGMAFGPVIGSIVRVHYGFDAMFLTSALLGAVALILSTRLKETVPNPKSISLAHFNLFKGQLLDWASWPAALVLIAPAFAFGVFLTVSPDFVASLGYTYKGLFNAIIVVSSVATRLFAGTWADRFGRIPVLIAGNALLTIGMLLIGLADEQWEANLGGVIYGVSVGMNMPAIFAWTVDFAKPGKTALALGTMLMSLELGIGAGAVYSGYIYQGDLNMIQFTYLTAAGIALLGVGTLFLLKQRFHEPRVN